MKRFVALGGLVALSLSSLAACGGETLDENVDETTAAVVPNPMMPDPATAPVKLHNFQTGKCLGVAGGTPTPGNFLIVWPCDGSANQIWQSVPHPMSSAGNRGLKNFVAEDRFLSIQSIQANQGWGNGNIAIIDKANIPNIFKEFWTIYFVGPDLMGHNCYYISSGWGNADQILGVLGGRPTDTRVVTWQGFFTNFQAHPDQLWCAY